jgi:hypothetical protein
MIISRRLTNIFSKRAAIIAVSLIGISLTYDASAFPIPLGAGFQWFSEDNSNVNILGPATIKTKKRNIRTGEISDHEIIVRPGGSLIITDTKMKRGRGSVKTVTGDPLAELEGIIDFGSGTFTLQSTDIDNLFSNATVDLTFVSGDFNAAVTLPGNQLVGPDGNDTYISWNSSWFSLDPIGELSDGIDNYNIFLGAFELNGISEPAPGIRPSNFSYNFVSANTGLMNFTVLDQLVIGETNYFGTVTKSLKFTVPEPSCLSYVAFSFFGFLAFGHRLVSRHHVNRRRLS